MSTQPAERRTVAVLFCDLSGFTRLSENMDPEDVRDTVDGLFARFRAAIEAQGGTVDKFMGDAVMAVFGAPVAHEDDPSRAVRAGLALQDILAAYNAERGFDLRLRVGINAGEVLWGSVGGDRATAMGDAVNVAQRLEAAARPGAVLVSRAVERSARRRFAFVPVDAVKAKNREEVVEVFEATGAHTGPAEFTNDLPQVPFVGRRDELASLAALLERDRAAFVRVEGAPGVGKSRLLGEFRLAARRRHPGLWVGVGRAQEGARLPLSPLRDVLLAESGVSVVEDPARLAAALAAQLEGASGVERENMAHLLAMSVGAPVAGARVHDMEPERRRFETFRAWEAWLRARLRGGRGLLVLEDVHWADDAALELAEGLAERLAGDRLVFVAAARPGGRALRGFETIALGELGGDESVRLAESHLGAAASPPLRAFLLEKSGGNPLYLEELARFLVEEGLARGNPVELPAAPDRIPQGLQGLLVARLDGLGAHKEALKAASVLGRSFWKAFVARLLGGPADEAIAEACRRGLVLPRATSLLPGDEEFVFRHALLRDAAYGLVTKRDRARLHGAVADALQGGARPLRTLAASHRESAGQTEAAAKEWHLLAREAMDAGSFEEGVTAGRRAVALGAPPEARLLTASALNGTADYAACEAELAGLEADPRASAELQLEGRLLGAQLAERRSLAEGLKSVEHVLQQASPGPLRLRALLRRGNVLGSLGRRQEAIADFEEVLKTAGPASEAADCDAATGQLAASALGSLSGIAWHLAEYQRSEAALDRSIACWRRFGNRAGLAGALLLKGGTCEMRKRHAEAATHIAEALEIRRSVGDRFGAAACQGVLGSIRMSAGRPDLARAEYEGALSLSRSIASPTRIASALNGLAVVEIHEGKVGASRALHEESLALRRSIGEVHGMADDLASLATIAILEGRLGASLAFGREALDLYRSMGHEFNARQIVIDMFDARRMSGDARGAFESIDPIAGSDSTFQASEALFLRARHTLESTPASALQDARQAEGLFEHELNPDNVLNARMLAAAAEVLLGRVPAALPDPKFEALPDGFLARLRRLEVQAVLKSILGDAAGARAAAERGARISEEAGASGWAGEFRKLIERIPRP